MIFSSPFLNAITYFKPFLPKGALLDTIFYQCLHLDIQCLHRLGFCLGEILPISYMVRNFLNFLFLYYSSFLDQIVNLQ